MENTISLLQIRPDRSGLILVNLRYHPSSTHLTSMEHFANITIYVVRVSFLLFPRCIICGCFTSTRGASYGLVDTFTVIELQGQLYLSHDHEQQAMVDDGETGFLTGET